MPHALNQNHMNTSKSCPIKNINQLNEDYFMNQITVSFELIVCFVQCGCKVFLLLSYRIFFSSFSFLRQFNSSIQLDESFSLHLQINLTDSEERRNISTQTGKQTTEKVFKYTIHHLAGYYGHPPRDCYGQTKSPASK